MPRWIEDLEEEYKDQEKDRYYFEMQAVLGYKKDKEAAYDKNGNFHCINWFDCQYCPARNDNCL